jgi:hypothetical protein
MFGSIKNNIKVGIEENIDFIIPPLPLDVFDCRCINSWGYILINEFDVIF